MSLSTLTPTSTLPLHTGRPIPRLGYGVYKAAGDECATGVKEAVKTGWKMVDSAQMYHNEKICGTALLSGSLKRPDIYLTSKLKPTEAPLPAAEIADLNRQSAVDLDQLSPKEGGKAYLDLLLVHAPFGGKEGRAKNWAAVAKSQEEGVTKDIGVSNFSVAHLSALPEPLPTVNQIELHPWCQQRELAAYCKDKGILVQAYAPLARAEKEKWGDAAFQKVCKRVEGRWKEGQGAGQGKEKEGGWEGRVLVRWSMQKGYIPLIKSVTPARIGHNIDVFDFELTDEDMAELDALDRGEEGAITWNPLGVE